MNYYPFHLGDYSAHTMHLEPLEDLAYRRMLDLYYLREQPLPSPPPDVARLIRLRQHVAEVESVLNEFFTPTDEGWRHARCDAEIERMQDKQAKARASAAASVKARSTNAQRTLNERSTADQNEVNARSTDVELPTPTPTPTPTPEEKEKESPRKRSSAPTWPEGVDEQVWADWLQLRKAKKAPVTQTVVNGAAKEAEKAGLSLNDFLAIWCRRGSQGLEADWLKPDERAQAGKARSKHSGFAELNYRDGVNDDGSFE